MVAESEADATLHLRSLPSQLCREKVKGPTPAAISPSLSSYTRPKRNCSRPQLAGGTSRPCPRRFYPFKREPYRIATTLNLAEVTSFQRNDGSTRGHIGLYFQVSLLEQDASEMLSLLRSIKNTFSPISRVPPEVFSLLPNYWGRQNYWDRQDVDRDLISLTHVCRSWRAIFTSHSSLWTWLDCKNADKTHVYIKRSRSLPLEVSLIESGHITYHDDALLAATSHIDRLSSLAIYKYSQGLQDLLGRFPFPAPLLKELKIVLCGVFGSDAAIPGEKFPEDLTPLRKLSLPGVVTHLPWRNLLNLTEFELCPLPMTADSPSIIQLLDFFESAPLLRKIVLFNSIPSHVGIPPNRVVSLRDLERLTIDELPVHSTLFDHLSIPTGASLDLRFYFPTPVPQTPVCLTNNLGNLYHITTINLLLNTTFWTDTRLSGPSGELRMSGSQMGKSSLIFQSLRKLDLSKTQMLSVTGCSPARGDEIEESSVLQLLPLMNDLRTLTLIRVDYRRFVRALNPEKNETRTVLCPQLEEPVLYFERRDQVEAKELVEMASERAKKHSKLSSIIIVSLGGCHPRKEVSSLKKYVSRVKYTSEGSTPGWDTVFGGVDNSGYDSDWCAFPAVVEGDDEDSDSD